MRRIGMVFQPSFPPERLRAVVERAERAGVPELWLWEDCFRESGFAAAAAALAWSDRLRVGIGVAPMPLRSAAITAMEIATIDRMFPGRFLPGVGHGVQRWMAQAGVRVASPLGLMREYLPVLRALLDGEEVSTAGRYVTLNAVRLDWPPAEPIAILAAGEGPKTLAATGELADGTVLTGGTSLARAREAVRLVSEARTAAGRQGESTFVIYLFTAFGTSDAARAAARAGVEAEFDRWGLEDDSRTAAVGDAAQVAAVAEEFFAAGVGTVVLQPMSDEPDLDGFVDQVGRVAELVAAGSGGSAASVAS